MSVSSLAIAAFFSSPLRAESGSADGTAAEAAAPAAGGQADGGEIIVTANKRQESMSKVGLAITALGGASLRAKNIVSLADIAAAVPGLSFTPSNSLSPIYTLRGVGFYETTLAAYPATSVYVDQAPLPFPAMTAHANFDLERIEVLKGPQGTLFGQNSTGGAINFIAAKPTSQFEAGGNLTYGRFNNVAGDVYLSGPVTNTVKARLALTGAREAAWQYSYTGPETIGRTKYYGGRLVVDWQPSPDLTFQMAFTAWRDQSDPQVPQYQTLLSQAPAFTNPLLRAYPFSPRDARAADWGPHQPSNDSRLLQPTLRADWRFADGLSLTSLSSYASYRQRGGVDSDGTKLDAEDVYVINGDIRSFTQELRLANTDVSRLRWVLGVNYEKTHVFERNDTGFSQVSTAALFGYRSAYNTTDQHMQNMAAFGNIEYKVGSAVTLKGGARYTEAKRRALSCSRDTGDGSLAPVFQSLSQAIQLGYVPVAGFTPTGIILPPVGQSCLPLDNITSDGTPATYLPSAFNGRLNEKNVSWRAGVDYQLNREMLLYANVAKGFKAGSFPIISGATLAQYVGVKQESLLSYEAGFKYSGGPALQISGAAFYYDYSNKQLRGKIVDPIFGTLDSLRNIPKSRIIGLEMDALYAPVAGLTIGLSGSVLDSKITQYVGLDTLGRDLDLSGSEIPYTPKVQGRLSVDYAWHAGADLQPFIGFDVNARSSASAAIGGARVIVLTSDYASSVPLADTFTIKGYTLVDVRAGLKAADGRWSITAFGKNVFNKFYLTNIFTDYDTISRFTGRPVTYGVTIAAKFR